MEIKEFYHKNNIRLSVFNLTSQGIGFHRHQIVSDISVCTKGNVEVQLLDQQHSYRLSPWEYFQVQNNCWHRVIAADSCSTARYVLIQLGDFDIEFAEAMQQPKLNETFVSMRYEEKLPLISEMGPELSLLGDLFERHPHRELSQEENSDVIQGIRLILSKTK
ncbi:MAG: hypothetical protein AAF483_26875 [Planctomycetota bacterium]